MKKLHTERAVKALLVLAAAVLLIVWALFVWNDTRIRSYAAGSIPMAEDTMDYIFTIESLDDKDDHVSITVDYLSLDGWILCRGWSSSRVSVRILLRNTDTDEWFLLPTTVKPRTDVTERIGDGCVYDYSGFSVKVPQGGKIDTRTYDYEIYALFNLNNIPRVVPANTTVRNWQPPVGEAEDE